MSLNLYFGNDLAKHIQVIADIDEQIIEKEFPKIIEKLKIDDLETQSFFLHVIELYIKSTILKHYMGEPDFASHLANLIHERFHRTWKVTNKDAYNIWRECCISANDISKSKNIKFLEGKKRAMKYNVVVEDIVWNRIYKD